MGVLDWVFESGLVAIIGGSYSLLLGYGKVRGSKDPERARKYLEKYGTLLKVFGLLAAVGGLVRFVVFLRAA